MFLFAITFRAQPSYIKSRSKKKKELVYYCKIDTLVKVGSCSNLTYQDFVSIKISRPDSSDIVLAVKDRLDALMWISWIVRISKGMDASAQFSIPLYKNGVYMGRVPIGDMMEPSQLDDTQWRMTQSPIF